MWRCGILFLILILLFNLNPIFANQEPPLELDTIVVTKNKIHLLNPYSLEFDNSPNPYPKLSPIESLASLPLDLQSRSLKQGIQSDFSLRGSTFQGVLILLDSNRINDPQTAHHNADIPLTKEDIQAIEVIPGVGSSLFGPDAMGGAVNFIVKKPKTKNMVLELSAGSHQAKSGIFSISDRIGELALRLSLEREESDGFRYDTDFKKFTTRLDSSMDLPCGEFNLGLGYQEKEFGAYDFYTPGLGYPSKEWTKTYLLDTGIVLDKEGLIIKPNFLWRRHYDKFMLDETGVRSTYLNYHRTDIFTPNIYLQKEIEDLGRVGLGLEYGDEQINSTNLGKHNRIHKSIFMDESKDLTPRISFGLSGRWDDFAGFESIYTGSINFRYRLSKEDSLHFGISRNMRVPSFTELYYNDPTTIGNIGLAAEKALNYEIGYDYIKDGLSLGSTFFSRQEEDCVDWIKRTPPQTKWQVENITKDEVTGIESYLNLALNQNFSLISNYTYINKYIDDQGYLYKYGPNYIRHLFNTAFSFKLPFGTQEFGLTYKKRPHRDGWLLVETNLNYSLNKHSQAFCKITNLLNVEYQEIEGIPQPGRWIECGIRLDW